MGGRRNKGQGRGPRRSLNQEVAALQKKQKKVNHHTTATRGDDMRLALPGDDDYDEVIPLEEGTHISDRGQLTCIVKLSDLDPFVRESACNDVSTLVLDPVHRQEFYRQKVHEMLTKLLLDSDLTVGAAAASALRNFLFSSSDEVIDSIVPSCEQRTQQGLQDGVLDASVCLVQAMSIAWSQLNEHQQNIESSAERQMQMKCADAAEVAACALDEFLQLADVLIDGSEAAAETFAKPEPLSGIVSIIVSLTRLTAVQNSAVDVLFTLSEENPTVATYITTQLTPEQHAFFNSATSAVPLSPTLLRISVKLSGVLLNCDPSVTSVQRILPIIIAAISITPMEQVTTVLPLLSSCGNSQLDPIVRQSGVSQTFDRLKAQLGALEIFAHMLDIVVDQNDEKEPDDVVATSRNVHAATLWESGIITLIVTRAGEMMAPITDTVVRSALSQEAGSQDLTTLQRLIQSIRIAVFGAASSLMMLLPLRAQFGDAGIQSMWGSVIEAIGERVEAVQNPGQSSVAQLSLQMESLASMSWTLQRQGEALLAEATHLDCLTRCAWLPSATSDTRVSCIGVIGGIGQRLATAATNQGSAAPEQVSAHYVCANFLARALQQGVQSMFNFAAKGFAPEGHAEDISLSEAVDLTAEAANTLMDLYADDHFDASGYIPLSIHQSLKDMLPKLKQYIKGLRAGGRKTAAFARKEHLAEVAENCEAFLAYKKKNTKWQ